MVQPIFSKWKSQNTIFTKLVFRGGGAPLTKGICSILRKCEWHVLYLISCWYDMKQSKTCTKIIKLWYLSGYWSFHKFIRISSYSLPTPHLITGKFVHFKLENLGDRNSLIDLRDLGNLMTGWCLDWSWNVKVFIIWWKKFSVLFSSDELTHCIHNLWYLSIRGGLNKKKWMEFSIQWHFKCNKDPVQFVLK